MTNIPFNFPQLLAADLVSTQVVPYESVRDASIGFSMGLISHALWLMGWSPGVRCRDQFLGGCRDGDRARPHDLPWGNLPPINLLVGATIRADG
jgi:hypothetical protein